MNVNITVDATNLNRKIESLYDALIGAGQQGDAATIITDEARRYIKQVLKFTPPKSQAQGRAAVSRDIARAATPITANYFRNPKLRERFREMTEVESRSNEEIEQFLRNAGWKKAKVRTFTPELHKSARDRRGRVQSSKNVFILEFERWKKYVRVVQSFVGNMKSGWVPAYTSLGGKVPSWIKRHTTGRISQTGFVVNALHGERPSITIGNVARGVGGIRHLASQALQARKQAISRRIRLILSGYSKDIGQGMRPKSRAKPSPETFYAE